MNTKRTYNALALFGQISIGFQALISLAFAVLLLVTGSMFMGSRYELAPAIVQRVQCTKPKDVCGVAVAYAYKGREYFGTFETMRYTAYTPGDAIFVRVNPGEPTMVSEDLPWKTMGFGMVAGAVALGYIAYYAFHLVSDNRNMAALAGTFSFLRFLVA